MLYCIHKNMARIFHRAANKVMNSRDRHESIGLLISDEKVVYKSYQKVVTAQVDESISLLRWAKSEENLALKDVFSKAFEVSCMWTSSWRDFNQEYYKYRKTFKEVLREERVLDEERRRQAMHTTKLNRLQKQLEQTKRKGDADRCCSLANEIVEVVSQAENGQAELEVKATKLEMLKAEKLRDSMLQISVGLNQWASKTLLVAEAYSKLANLIPDTPTKVSRSKIFYGTSESRNIVNNLARDLIIDTELSQQLKYMSYVVSRPILPAQQNGVKCNHVGLNSEKMPGKVNRKPVGQKGMLPQALCHHHLRAKKMDPNFGRAQSVPDLRPPPTPPPPPGRLPKEAPAQTTSKMLPDNNNNIQWYASANISSYSDSDWEEGYAKPYSDPRLAQRKMLSKAASDGAINTAIGRVYEDKDKAMCQRTEKQSEEDFSHDNDSAVYVDFTDDVERMMQPNEIVIPNGTSESRNIVNNLARDRIIDSGLSQQLKDMSHSAQSSLYAVSTPILPAQQNGVKCIHVGLNCEKMPGKVNRKPEGQKGSPQALCHHHLRAKKLDPNFGRAQSVPDLRPPPNPPPPPGRLSKEAPAQTTSKMLPDNNNNIQWDASANISSDSDSDWEEGYAKPDSDPRLAKRKMFWKPASDGAINTDGRVYEDQDSATCQCTEKQSEEDMSHDDDSAAYVDFTGDVERMMQPNEIVARQ